MGEGRSFTTEAGRPRRRTGPKGVWEGRRRQAGGNARRNGPRATSHERRIGDSGRVDSVHHLLSSHRDAKTQRTGHGLRPPRNTRTEESIAERNEKRRKKGETGRWASMHPGYIPRSRLFRTLLRFHAPTRPLAAASSLPRGVPPHSSPCRGSPVPLYYLQRDTEDERQTSWRTETGGSNVESSK
jgi:hypothetical protein